MVWSLCYQLTKTCTYEDAQITLDQGKGDFAENSTLNTIAKKMTQARLQTVHYL